MDPAGDAEPSNVKVWQWRLALKPSDNLCKELGLGTLPEERGIYDASVLRVLGVAPGRVEAIRDRLGQATVQQVMDIVERCTGAA